MIYVVTKTVTFPVPMGSMFCYQVPGDKWWMSVQPMGHAHHFTAYEGVKVKVGDGAGEAEAEKLKQLEEEGFLKPEEPVEESNG